jgi:hypothetical protein
MAKKPPKKAIPAVQRVVDLPLRFSFKHLDFENPKFRPTDCCAEYFHKLFEMLQRYSTWTVEQFIDQNNQEHRHIIIFSDTTEPEGFQRIPKLDPDQFGFQEGWQFAVYPERRWNLYRAHGILIDDTFYIVWLDQEHNLYPKPQPAPQATQ